MSKEHFKKKFKHVNVFKSKFKSTIIKIYEWIFFKFTVLTVVFMHMGRCSQSQTIHLEE